MTVQLLEAANSGELDPLLLGRRSLPAYATGLRRGLNCIALPAGATVRRPGMRRAGNAHGGARWTNSFIFGVGDAYTLEFADELLRFWRADGSQVMQSAAAPLEIDTPWTAQQATGLRSQRSGDVMWFVGAGLPMQELKRTALAPGEAFTLDPADLQDGPYYAENPVAATTLTSPGTHAAGADGAIVFSADVLDDSSPSADIGRHIRAKIGDTDHQSWSWGKIKTVTDKRNAVVTWVTPVITVSATPAFRLGLYNARTGWPVAIAIFQERLALASAVANSFPRVDFSCSGQFLTFTPGTDDDQAIEAVIAITVADNGVPVIRDMKAGNGALLVATGAGVLRIGSSSTSSSTLTPTNIAVDPIEGSAGAGTVPAISADGTMLYVDLQHRSLGEIRQGVAGVPESYAYREISIRNGHLLRESPVASIAWASKPWGLVVIAREDGALVIGSYAPAENVINFTPQQLAAGGLAASVNVLPTTEGHEIWALVERAGSSGLEVMTNLLREDQPDRLAVNLDSSISGKNAPDAALAFVADLGGGVQTWRASSAVFVAGHLGKAICVLEPGDRDPLNMRTWRARILRIALVSSATDVHLALESDAWPASPVAAGDWLVSRTRVDGLDPLEGQQVLLFADGAQLGPFTVVGGGVDLPAERFYVTAGLAYRSEFQPMPPNPATTKGSALGRPIGARIRVSVVRTGGLKQVQFDGSLSGVRPLRHGVMASAMAPPLYTGDMEIEPLPDSDTPVAPFLVADGAYPFTITALAPDYGVGELG